MTPQVRTTVRDDVAPVRLLVAGEIDLATVDWFRAALTSAITQYGRVVVDLTEVEFLGSIGIGVLYTHAEQLAGVSVTEGTIISRAITVSGLDLVVAVLPTTPEHEPRRPPSRS